MTALRVLLGILMVAFWVFALIEMRKRERQ